VRRLTVAAAMLIAIVGTTGAAASARDGEGPRKPKPTGTSAGGTPQVAILLDGSGSTIATYHRASAGGSGGSGSTATWRCWYYEPTTKGGPVPGIDRSHVATVEVGGTYWLYCDDPDDNQAYVALVTWDPQNPFGPLAAADRAADAARNAVVLLDPDIGTSPAAAGPQLVGLPTWLWVTEAWTPRSASATLGGVTAQVTATPATITWNPGDGTPAFTCAGPGPAWDDHHPDRTSPCTHTYRDRSTTTDPHGTFALTATISYTVRWQATNGDAGELEPVTRSTTIRLLVREAQAVIQ